MDRDGWTSACSVPYCWAKDFSDLEINASATTAAAVFDIMVEPDKAFCLSLNKISTRKKGARDADSCIFDSLLERGFYL